MSKRNSDWYIPPDWLWLMGPFIVLPCTVVLAGMLLPIVAKLQTADRRALYGFGLGTGAIGAVLLFVARLPLYKQHRFWTSVRCSWIGSIAAFMGRRTLSSWPVCCCLASSG